MSDAVGGPTYEDLNERVTSPAHLVCLMLFLATDVFSGQTGGLPLPIGPDRILFAGFLVLLAFDRRVSWRGWRVQSATWVAAATLLWAIGSAYAHDTLGTSLGRFAILDRLAIPYLLFVLAPVALATRGSRILLLKLLAVMGVYLGLTAIFELLGPHSLVFPTYISNPAVGISYGRARGPFLASDADASAMATCLFGCYALWAASRNRAWRSCAVVSGALCLTGVLLALTRAEWIGTAVGIVAVALLVPQLRRKLPVVVLLGVIFVAILLAASPTLRSDVTSRTQYVASVYDRRNTDAGGVRALQSDPLVGIGWEKFIGSSYRYVRQARTYPITNVSIEIHNVPLSRLAELGLVGGGMWILSVLLGPVAAIFVGRRDDPVDEAYRVAYVGIAIVWLVAIEFSPFSYPLPNALVWLVSGVVLAPLDRHVAKPLPLAGAS